MKQRKVWKPNGHPRRGEASAKLDRKKLKPKGAIPGKGVKRHGEGSCQAA